MVLIIKTLSKITRIEILKRDAEIEFLKNIDRSETIVVGCPNSGICAGIAYASKADLMYKQIIEKYLVRLLSKRYKKIFLILYIQTQYLIFLKY